VTALLAGELAQGERVLVDTEAGVEHFGRGVEEGADQVLIIVDPSHEAVLLAEKAAGLAREAGKPFGIVLTKTDEETGPLLMERINARGLETLGAIPHSPSLTRANLLGEPLAGASGNGALADIVAGLRGTTRPGGRP
jgi:CO dehydrogenase maturation factor